VTVDEHKPTLRTLESGLSVEFGTRGNPDEMPVVHLAVPCACGSEQHEWTLDVWPGDWKQHEVEA